MEDMITFFPYMEGVRACMSLKKDGNMKVHGTQQDDAAIANRKKFCDQHGIPYEHLVSSLVRHTSAASVVDDASRHFVHESDGLVTKTPNVFLGVTVADCFPVVFFDPAARIVGVAHAGWRGVVGGVIPATIDKMLSCGAHAKDIRVAIGPGISQRHFAFQLTEMRKKFGAYNQDRYVIVGDTPDKVKVNLQSIILDQLEECGILPAHVRESTNCTYANADSFFSARRAAGQPVAAMLVAIGLPA